MNEYLAWKEAPRHPVYRRWRWPLPDHNDDDDDDVDVVDDDDVYVLSSGKSTL
jgi:hypothetical protein